MQFCPFCQPEITKNFYFRHSQATSENFWPLLTLFTSISDRSDDSLILGSRTTRNCAVLHQRKIAAEFSAVRSLPIFLRLVICFLKPGFQIRPITANFGDISTIYATRAEGDPPLFSVHFNRIDATAQAPVLLFCNGIAFSIHQR